VQCAFVGPDSGRVYALEAIPGGDHLVAWDLFTSAKLWELPDDVHGRFAVSGDGQTLLQWNGMVCDLWNGQTGQPLRHLTLPKEINATSTHSHVTLSLDGRVAAFSDSDSNSGLGCTFVELEHGTVLETTEFAGSYRCPPALNHDGTLALAVVQYNVANLIDTRTGKAIGRFERPTPINFATFAADGRVFTFGENELCQWPKPTLEDLAQVVMPIRLKGAASVTSR